MTDGPEDELRPRRLEHEHARLAALLDGIDDHPDVAAQESALARARESFALSHSRARTRCMMLTLADGTGQVRVDPTTIIRMAKQGEGTLVICRGPMNARGGIRVIPLRVRESEERIEQLIDQA